MSFLLTRHSLFPVLFRNRSVLEDVVVKFHPESHVLAQKIAILIDVIAGGVTGDPPPQKVIATPTKARGRRKCPAPGEGG